LESLLRSSPSRGRSPTVVPPPPVLFFLLGGNLTLRSSFFRFSPGAGPLCPLRSTPPSHHDYFLFGLAPPLPSPFFSPPLKCHSGGSPSPPNWSSFQDRIDPVSQSPSLRTRTVFFLTLFSVFTITQDRWYYFTLFPLLVPVSGLLVPSAIHS